ncbi:MAG: Gfo/Idh/MocA family oxidoreductase [Chloroflexota bacterium]
MTQPIKLAQIGYGYWGPNLARNFYQIPDADFACLVDLDAHVRTKATQLYDCATTDSYESILEDASIEAIVIAIPARTHHPFAKQALEAGKHVFV